jgi:hypothetical protein
MTGGALVFAGALTPKANAQTAPLAPEKVQAKQEAVAAHAAKRKACKAEAKAQKLHRKQRQTFMKDCMAR